LILKLLRYCNELTELMRARIFAAFGTPVRRLLLIENEYGAH